MSDHRSVVVDDDDARTVLSAAKLLDVSEFQVFEFAYRAWFQEEPIESVIERHFVPYMFHEVVPFWVRHYARATLQERGDWQAQQQMSAGGYGRELLATLAASVVDTLDLAMHLFLSPFADPVPTAAGDALPA